MSHTTQETALQEATPRKTITVGSYSTAHMTEKDAKLLDRHLHVDGTGGAPSPLLSDDFGYWIWTGSDEEAGRPAIIDELGLSDTCAAAVKDAFDRGYWFIRFDTDEKPYEDLPSAEWVESLPEESLPEEAVS